MKRLNIVLLLIVLGCKANGQTTQNKAPSFVLGAFKDDYGISYLINDTLWLQNPNIKFHIIKWNLKKQYLVAKNDAKNITDGNKYTRIDYMIFNQMEPYLWGFCLTAYDAETDIIAEKTAFVDRQNPKKGCNGYPFSRMKVSDTPTLN
jgi:hypothetical protein